MDRKATDEGARMKKRPNTPKSQIRSALRRLWNRSRERSAALKRDGYCCQECGKKQSKAKGREVAVVVHHLDGINWDGLVELVSRRLLQDPSKLTTLCVACHEEEEARLKRFKEV
jgi:5-methylcytosine-specific restriction endonuclease McrA